MAVELFNSYSDGLWEVTTAADGRGRRVVAGPAGIRAGQLVLEDEPFACAPYPEARAQQRCDCCLASAETPLLR